MCRKDKIFNGALMTFFKSNTLKNVIFIFIFIFNLLNHEKLYINREMPKQIRRLKKKQELLERQPLRLVIEN